MIVTLTANPSVDRTMQLDSPIVRGDVFRATSVGDEAGGKGVNVARAVAHAGVPAVAVLPADDDDLLVKGLIAAGVHPVNVPVGRPSRVNITVTEPDGTTTKFNDPGHAFSADVMAAGRATPAQPLARQQLGGAVRLAAPGRRRRPGTASSPHSSSRPAAASPSTRRAPRWPRPLSDASHLPDLLKPNAEELASLTGDDWTALEADPVAAAAAASRLVNDGVGAVLLTLGSEGAVLITPEGTWRATPPPHHSAEHRRCRRRQPGWLPACRPSWAAMLQKGCARQLPTAQPLLRSTGRRCPER